MESENSSISFNTKSNGSFNEGCFHLWGITSSDLADSAESFDAFHTSGVLTRLNFNLIVRNTSISVWVVLLLD